MYIDNWQTQLRKGMLDIVIMNLLSHGSCHGYEMVQRMKKITFVKAMFIRFWPDCRRKNWSKVLPNPAQTARRGSISKLPPQELKHWNK
jgi:hypothetical protein